MSKSKKTKVPSPVSPAEAQQLAQAQAARKQGVTDVARTLLERLVAARPDFVSARYELALTFISADEYEAAENHLRMIVKHTPDMREAWVSLALINHRLGRAANELECLRRAVAIKTDARLVRRLFELYRDSGNHQTAFQMLETLRKLDDSPLLALEILEQQVRLGLIDVAEAGYASLMEKMVPAPVQAVEQWVKLLMDKGQVEAVISKITAMIAQGRREAVFYATLGRAYTLSERTRDAIEAYSHAVGMDPSHTGWWHDLSVGQRQMGDMDGSQASLVRALTLDPYNAAALRVYGVEYKYSYGDAAFKRLNAAHALIDKYTPPGKAQLHNALAKAYEDVEELDAAFKHYEAGGRIQTRLEPYRHNKVVSLFKLMALKLKRPHYEDIQRTGCPSDKPVFVFGMPRSGTSLVEQIIASHPEAYGAGELKLLHRVVDGLVVNGMTIHTKEQTGSIQTYIPGVSLNCNNLDYRQRGERYIQAIEAVAGASSRKVVDKMPGNYYWTGLIPLILPNARIIHTRRHPVATLLSCYRIFFPDGIPWSYDLRHLGMAYRAYHQHMKYWEQTLPEGILLNVRYEDVIADVEGQAKRIIAHCGLEWDDACLKFYETERAVKTASLAQVRKPIYTTSMNRWRKYEAYLGPLLKELGPLVEEYEAELQNDPAPAAGVNK